MTYIYISTSFIYSTRYHRYAIYKFRSEKYIGIVEHSIFKRNDYELKHIHLFLLINMTETILTKLTWLFLKWDFNMFPIFCVWERSKAASTSSRMYSGAGLNSNIANIRDNAAKDLWPPLSSVRLSFQTPPSETLT